MAVEGWLQIALMSIFMLVLEMRFWLEAKFEALHARLLELEGRQSIAESQRGKPYLCYRCKMAHDMPTVAR